MNVVSTSPQQIPAKHDGRRAWVRPQLQRLSAGGAEDGVGNNPDGGQNS